MSIFGADKHNEYVDEGFSTHNFCFGFFFLSMHLCLFTANELLALSDCLPNRWKIENSSTFMCGNRIESGSIIYLIPLLVFPFDSEWSGWAPSRAHTPLFHRKLSIPLLRIDARTECDSWQK